MPTTVKDLQAECDALHAQRAGYDMPTLQTALTTATQALEAHLAGPTGNRWPDPEETRLLRDVSLAKNAMENATYALRNIDRQASPLSEMLSAPKRAAQAREDLAALLAQAKAAQATADSASDTVKVLRGQLADAEAQHLADRDQTAHAILTAAKQGKALAPATADRGGVLALESALTLATAEHEAALQTLEAIQGRIAATETELTHAARDSAALQFELVQRDFAVAVAAYRAVVPEFTITDDLMQRVYVVESTEQAHDVTR